MRPPEEGEGDEASVVGEREVDGRAAPVDLHPRDPLLGDDPDAARMDAEPGREGGDREPADGDAGPSSLAGGRCQQRDPGDHGAGGGVLRAGDRVNRSRTLADADRESAPAARDGSAPALQADQRPGRREEGVGVQAARRLEGALLGGPEPPAQGLGLPAAGDRGAFGGGEDPLVEARVARLRPQLRIPQVDDVVADDRGLLAGEGPGAAATP
jgi:hypothetical protein